MKFQLVIILIICQGVSSLQKAGLFKRCSFRKETLPIILSAPCSPAVRVPNLNRELTKMYLNIGSLIPQNLILVGLQEIWRLQIHRSEKDVHRGVDSEERWGQPRHSMSRSVDLGPSEPPPAPPEPPQEHQNHPGPSEPRSAHTYPPAPLWGCEGLVGNPWSM